MSAHSIGTVHSKRGLSLRTDLGPDTPIHPHQLPPVLGGWGGHSHTPTHLLIRAACLLLAGTLLIPLTVGAQEPPEPEAPQVKNAYGTWPKVVTSLVFPVLASRVDWHDSFGAPRDGGRRKHQGQDLAAPKMTPLVAAFDGTVSFHRTDQPNIHNILYLRGDHGWSAAYMHINNDTPGTDDGLGSMDYAFAPGLEPGDRVVAGQFLGWVGDSGNAENTGPHLHFELYGPEGTVNAAPSLRLAKRLTVARMAPVAPGVRPAGGETRLDGAVRSADTARGLLCMDLIASEPHRKPRTIITRPVQRWIRLEGVRLALADGTDAGVEAASLPRRTRVTALVRTVGPGRADLAVRLALHRAPAVAEPMVRAAAPIDVGIPVPPPLPSGRVRSQAHNSDSSRPHTHTPTLPHHRPQGGPAAGRVVPKADVKLPRIQGAEGVKLLAERVLPAPASGKVTLAGGWDQTYLYVTLGAPERFRARLEVGDLVLWAGESGVRTEDGTQVAGAATLVSPDGRGGTLLRVLLPLRTLPAGGPDRLLRLRAVLETSSGKPVELPERREGLTVGLD